MDEDLDSTSRDQLVAEVQRLREGISAHRTSSGHALCWRRPGLWGLLPDGETPQPVVPAWPRFSPRLHPSGEPGRAASRRSAQRRPVSRMRRPTRPLGAYALAYRPRRR